MRGPLVILRVSPEAHAEIRQGLIDGGAAELIMPGDLLNMEDIALEADPRLPPFPRPERRKP